MKALRKSLWIVAAITALPAPAAASGEMCAALNRIAAAAQEPVPFASLERSQASLVPGYDHCRVETGTVARAGGVFCHQRFAPKSLIADVVAPQVRECLGAEPVPPERYSNASVFRTADMTISIESRCDERCHVGRIASITIQRRREEGSP